MKRWMLACFAVLSLLFVVASPTLAAPGGNNANAKACQKGGWETRARTETPGTTFLSQDECVSYGAQGGTIVPYVAPVTVLRFDLVGTCLWQIVGTGFVPGTTYTYWVYQNGTTPMLGSIVTADGDGNLAVAFPFDVSTASGLPLGTTLLAKVFDASGTFLVESNYTDPCTY